MTGCPLPFPVGTKQPPSAQVVCVFKMENMAPKAPAGESEEAESNSVESLGFCNV